MGHGSLPHRTRVSIAPWGAERRRGVVGEDEEVLVFSTKKNLQVVHTARVQDDAEAVGHDRSQGRIRAVVWIKTASHSRATARDLRRRRPFAEWRPDAMH